jgi:hypothetical protein
MELIGGILQPTQLGPNPIPFGIGLLGIIRFSAFLDERSLLVSFFNVFINGTDGACRFIISTKASKKNERKKLN